MNALIIRDRPGFRVTSYGNGMAYVLRNNSTGRDIYFQGDDAARFRDEMGGLESRFDDTDKVLAWLWFDYAEDAA